MQKILLILFVTTISVNSIFACLNGSNLELTDGTLIYAEHEISVPKGHRFSNFARYPDLIKKFERDYKTTNNLDYLSDKGLLLILLNQYEEAIKLYLEIEKLEPNRYSTASNIGTAYELLGKNEEALDWIKKSVEIDSTSHKNSEWIHVKILEAKLKGEAFYNTNFILNTDFGLDILPSSKLSNDELQNLHDALFFQLHERMSFVEAPEKIVAQLLFDLGNIAFLLNHYSDAAENYQQAKSYGYSDQLLKDRLTEVEKKLKPTPQSQITVVKQSFNLQYGFYIAGIILLVILFMQIYRRKRKK